MEKEKPSENGETLKTEKNNREKTVWILYDEEDYAKNHFFVEQISRALQISIGQFYQQKKGETCKDTLRLPKEPEHKNTRNPLKEEERDTSNEYGCLVKIKTKVILTKALSFGILPGEKKICAFENGNRLSIPFFVIARTRDFKISRIIERMGIRVFNSSKVCEICNDKATTYQVAAMLGIPVLETYFGEEGMEKLSFPYIAKPVDGHGGEHVCKIEDSKQALEFKEKMKNRRYVVQKLANDPGKDVRVYVCGGRIIKAMLRQSESDFRSNFCLGGSAREYQLDEKQIQYVQKLQEYFQFDYAGIDFIFEDGKAVFNEIEDVVGARMLYQFTDVDILQIYADHCIQSMLAEREEGICDRGGNADGIGFVWADQDIF